MPAQGTSYQRYLPFRAFRGEVGVVYLCSDLDAHGAVALKSFEPALMQGRDSGALVRAAKDWIQIGAHPHVVAAHRIEGDDPLCLVLDFVEPNQGLESPSLREWLQAPLSPEAACAVGLGIVRGMRHATDRVCGLVHGDLCPENVLIGRDLRARVTDFGFAATTREGRHWYQPPGHRGNRADPRGDIYSFGMVLLEMLLGSRAFRALGDGVGRDGSVARNLALGCGAPDGLRPLVAACVAPTADLRPGSWSEIDRRLTAVWPSLSGREAPEIPDPETAAREEALMQAWSSQAVGHALRDRGAFEAALVTYRGVARTAARQGDASLAASALTHVGKVLQTLGHLETATRELLHALDLYQAVNDPHGKAAVMHVLGQVYAMRGEPDNALASLFSGARLSAEIGDRRGIAQCRKAMAPVLAAVGRTNEAQDAEAESLAILRDLDGG